MKRDFSFINDFYDVVIIGGGATGLGLAVDSVSRGFSTLLLEENDFAKGTSSRSTKLLHGGVRYLAQGDVGLVYEALHERSTMIANAPHLCKKQAFVIPAPNIFNAIYYYVGLSLYDFMAGKKGLGRTRLLSPKIVKNSINNINNEKLKYGILYYDGQFDDARVALNLALTAKDHGAHLLNYVKVTNLLKQDEKIVGVSIKDTLGDDFAKDIKAKCVFNATGVFTNHINFLDNDNECDIVPSQGIHLVFDKKFLKSQNALMVPKTSDGRVLFAIPWHDKLVVGTTDTLVNDISYEPKALDDEIKFILDTAKEYFDTPPTKDDIKSVFVGLRPLAKPSKTMETKKVSRSHKVHVSKSGLVSINGGKWTTYRTMAKDGIDEAIKHNLLENKPCVTQDLHHHGYDECMVFGDRLSVYGSDKKYILALEEDESLKKLIHKDHPFTYAQVKWAVENEFAYTIEDILSRRIRLLFLDARAARECANDVANFLIDNLKLDEKQLRLDEFLKLTEQYIYNQ